MPIKDHPQIILSQLKKIFTKPKRIKDPNTEINNILKKSERGQWYPPYLFRSSNDDYVMLKPFKSENYSKKECQEEIHGASLLIKKLKRHSIKAAMFYITETTDDIDCLAKLSPPKEFGVIYIGDDRIFIDRPIRKAFHVACKLCPKILEYLSTCKNLQGNIGGLVRKFSKEYLSKKPGGADENKMISIFCDKLLSSNQKHKVEMKSIELIKYIEEITGNHREHYFHSYNTMMLGFMILDKLYNIFKKIIDEKYGSDISLEDLWVLTSLFHDIGYAASKLDEIVSECLDIDPGESEDLLNSCIKQARKVKWEQDCSVPVDMLNDVFRHVSNRSAAKWDYDEHLRLKKNTPFKNAMQKSYIEMASHGTAGAIKMIKLTSDQLKRISNARARKWIKKCFAFASLAILLHDTKVRRCLKEVFIKNVKVVDFPLAALLVYADILQDERRDLTGTISRPDLISDIIVRGNIIVARLNRTSLTDPQKQNMLNELKEAFSFFVMNGITFAPPEELA